jgi:serine/threonine-protein kinase RsbW
LILDVADHDLAAEPQLINDRPLGAGGLGLRLTKTFAGEVGWYTTDATKQVGASFPS